MEIRKYNIIYDAVDDIRAAMEGMLTPELEEQTIGTVGGAQPLQDPQDRHSSPAAT